MNACKLFKLIEHARTVVADIEWVIFSDDNGFYAAESSGFDEVEPRLAHDYAEWRARGPHGAKDEELCRSILIAVDPTIVPCIHTYDDSRLVRRTPWTYSASVLVQRGGVVDVYLPEDPGPAYTREEWDSGLSARIHSRGPGAGFYIGNWPCFGSLNRN